MGISNFWISLHRPFSFFSCPVFTLIYVLFQWHVLGIVEKWNAFVFERISWYQRFLISHCRVVSCVMNPACAYNSLGGKAFISLTEGGKWCSLIFGLLHLLWKSYSLLLSIDSNFLFWLSDSSTLGLGNLGFRLMFYIFWIGRRWRSLTPHYKYNGWLKVNQFLLTCQLNPNLTRKMSWTFELPSWVQLDIFYLI